MATCWDIADTLQLHYVRPGRLVACVPHGMSREVIELRVNRGGRQSPTGRQWRIIDLDGEIVFPEPCQGKPGRTHYLVEC